MEIVIAMRHKRFKKMSKAAGLFQRQLRAFKRIEHPCNIRVLFIQLAGLVCSGSGKLTDFIHVQAEQVEIFPADLIGYFNGGAVKRAHGEGAVERQLHIARAGGFSACR